MAIISAEHEIFTGCDHFFGRCSPVEMPAAQTARITTQKLLLTCFTIGERDALMKLIILTGKRRTGFTEDRYNDRSAGIPPNIGTGAAEYRDQA